MSRGAVGDMEALAEAARASPLGLGAYLGAQPGAKRFEAPRHLVALNAAIVEAVFGPRKRLIVAMPPQHAKSSTVSVLTPAWYLGTFPHRNVLLASYAAKLAKSLGRRARQIVESTGRSAYEVAVDPDVKAAGEWRLDGFGGGMVSAGVAGDFRGRSGDLVIVDDPIKDSKQALSPGYLDGLWDWFTSVLEGRLSPDATLIVVATRLHERDLAGRILSEFGDEWDHLRLPAIAEPGDALGRKVGEALWPERYDEAYLERRRRRVGSFWWAAEYQQRPAPAEGGIIQKAWIRFWGTAQRPRPERFDEVILSVDANLKETRGGSFAVIQVWGRLGADVYLLDELRGRWGFEGLLRAFETLANRYPAAGRKLVEDTAAGPAAMSILSRKWSGVTPIKVAGLGSKVARLRAVAPVFETGNVYVPNPELPGNAWVRVYVESLCAFPNGEGTDEGDATSQALAWFQTRALSSVSTSTSKAKAADLRREARLTERPRRRIGRLSLWDGPDQGGPRTTGPGTFGPLR